MLLRELHGHTVVASELSQSSVVVDLGANRGSFAHAVLAAFDCRCHAVEANPLLIAEIPTHPNLSVYNFAVAAQSGPKTLHVAENSEASSIYVSGPSTSAVVVNGLTLPDLWRTAALAQVDLVKFDVEGAEIEILDTCSDQFLQAIPQLTVEFHDFLGATPVATVERVVTRLQDLGFFPLKMWRHAWGDTLLVNRRLTSVPLVELVYGRLITRNWWGLKRVVNRWGGDGRRGQHKG